MVLSGAGVQPGVIGQRRHALALQPGRRLLHLLAAAAVDDPGVALVLVADEAQQLGARVVALDDGVADVRTVEAADEQARVLQLQPLDDVGAGVVVGGGGQRDARHRGEALVQRAQAEVFLAEVVAPLADAVRLVDREQAQQATLVQRLHHRQEARRQQPLRCDVEQRQPPGQQVALDRRGLLRAQRGVQEGRRHADLVERADLVLHQRDQRADHHRDPLAGAMAHDRRNLVAQTLAAAGGHQHQRVAAVDHLLDDVLLLAAEGGIAEHLGKHAPRGGDGGGRRVRVGRVHDRADGTRGRRAHPLTPNGETHLPPRPPPVAACPTAPPSRCTSTG